MIVVRVELWPFGDESLKRQLAEMRIANDGTGDHNVGHYDGVVLRAPDFSFGYKNGRVEDHPRLREHVWSLVSKMLKRMHY